MTKPDTPPRPQADDVAGALKAVAEIEHLLCDPACEGRCTSCPLDVVRSLAAEVETLKAEVESKSAQIGKLYRVCNEKHVLQNALERAESALAKVTSERDEARVRETVVGGPTPEFYRNATTYIRDPWKRLAEQLMAKYDSAAKHRSRKQG